MKTSELIKCLNAGEYDITFGQLYPRGDPAERRERFVRLATEFRELYGEHDAILFSVPGRTELSGNHTDHNNGMVLAAGVDIDIIAVAAAVPGTVVKMKSEGYREDIVDVAAADPSSVRKGSSGAIIAGVADYFRKNGLSVGGFAACTTSEVMTGSGLSSSAAFEVMCGRIFSELYNGGSVPAMELAHAGKYAENEFFGKPCGLMDQAACASGGCLWMDFKNSAEPKTSKLELDLRANGYSLCIVNTGGNHADLTADYAAVPAEMKSVAALLGKSTLRECREEDVAERVSYMRSIVGDRAILRALHFFAENRRVSLQKEALENGDIDTYLALVKESGSSSFRFLQNVYTNSNPAEQGISLALALTERMGIVCRVHGGGFAGTIQAYVPDERRAEYKAAMENVFGAGSCRAYTIRPYGASALYSDGIRG